MLSKRKQTASSLVAATAVVVVASLTSVPASGQRAQPRGGETIHHSPLPQITAGGRADWPLHNFDIKGSRYSSLDEINTSNVGRLALAWSFEVDSWTSISSVTTVVVDGVMYLHSGSTLFAVNAITGESIWTVTMDETLPPRGRGPAYGDGRVYAFGAATMYATDAKTGELVESFGDGG